MLISRSNSLLINIQGSMKSETTKRHEKIGKFREIYLSPHCALDVFLHVRKSQNESDVYRTTWNSHWLHERWCATRGVTSHLLVLSLFNGIHFKS